VSPVETRDDIVQRQTHLILVESKDALHHGSRSGVSVLEAFLSRDKKSGDDP
jgi:hypothetical protein